MATAHARIVDSAALRPPAKRWWPSFAPRGTGPRRTNTPALVATALLLLITLVAGYGAARLLPSHGGSQPAPMLSASTPATPPAGTCPITVRSTPPLISRNGTPVLPTTKTILPLPIPPQSLGVVTAKQPFADSTPAGRTAISAALTAVLNWRACIAAPKPTVSSMPPVVAIYSDDYFRRMPRQVPSQATPPANQRQSSSWWNAYDLSMGFSSAAAPDVSDIRQLPDGRIGAIVTINGRQPTYSYAVIFARQDGYWLIDELAIYTGSGTPVATQPPLSRVATPSATNEITIVLADIVFRPSTVAIPAYTPVTITLVNQGKIRHSFVIDAFHIRIELAPGARGQVVLDIPPGMYEFYCDIPGHKAAGMIGHLEVTTNATPVATP